MEIIDYNDFGKLRLSEIWPENKDIGKVDDFEFMNNFWVGEIYGFTQFLQLKREPDLTKSISLNLIDIPDDIVERIFKRIGLLLKKGISPETCKSILGEPLNIENHKNNKQTYNYVISNKSKYNLALTFKQDTGLIYVVINSQEII